MAAKLTHVEIEELLGAYALDAVSPDEAEALELHLRECPRCREEVATHREVAASLAHVGAQAPEGVWQRIAGSLEEAPPKLDMARVVSMAPHQARRAPRWQMAAASTAAVAIAVIGVLGVKLVDQDRRLRTLTAAVEGRGLENNAMAALVNPRARRVQLKSLDDKLTGEAVMLPDGSGYLLRPNLPALPADRTYQLWAMVGDSRISLGVLGRDPAVTAFKAATEVRALAITEEPAGGVTSTDKPPVVMGWVPEDEASSA